MNWFRRTSSFNGHLALFALVVQLVLSFGHVHLDQHGVANSAAASKIANVSDSEQVPVGNVPDSYEFCAICAIISLSGSLVVPEPPALVVFTTPSETLVLDRGVVLVARYERAQFQARAPPV
jgi:hypothetical protein